MLRPEIVRMSWFIGGLSAASWKCLARMLPSAYVSTRQHTSAYVQPGYSRFISGVLEEQPLEVLRTYADVSIRQHTPAYVSMRMLASWKGSSWKCLARMLTPAYVSTRPHTPAYVSIRMLASSKSST